MAAIEPSAPRMGRRREAAVDLGLLLCAAPFVVAVALALRFAPGPQTARIILGEPGEMLVLLAAATWALRRRGEGWRDLGLRRPASIGRMIALVGGALVLVYGLAALLVALLFGRGAMASPNLSLIAPALSTPGGYAAMLGLTWTTVAFGEELLFRSFLFSRLERLFGGSRGATAGAWLGQGLLFGTLHVYQGPSGMLTTSLIGLGLGGVYLATRRNLAACIAIHGVIDTLALTALFMVTTHRI